MQVVVRIGSTKRTMTCQVLDRCPNGNFMVRKPNGKIGFITPSSVLAYRQTVCVPAHKFDPTVAPTKPPLKPKQPVKRWSNGEIKPEPKLPENGERLQYFPPKYLAESGASAAMRLVDVGAVFKYQPVSPPITGTTGHTSGETLRPMKRGNKLPRTRKL